MHGHKYQPNLTNFQMSLASFFPIRAACQKSHSPKHVFLYFINIDPLICPPPHLLKNVLSLKAPRCTVCYTYKTTVSKRGIISEFSSLFRDGRTDSAEKCGKSAIFQNFTNIIIPRISLNDI